MRLVLASSSPRRRDLLGRLSKRFEVIEPDGVDEKAVRGLAREIATKLAALKAESVLGGEGLLRTLSFDETFILGADTVVAAESDGEEHVLGKPEDLDDARRMLRLLSGRAHQVWTGVAVASPGRLTRVEVERTEVVFRPLAAADVEVYLSSGDWHGKAGAYGIQSQGSALVESIRGCFYNVVGLPVVLTSRLLAEAGVKEYACDCLTCPLQQKPTKSFPRPCEPK